MSNWTRSNVSREQLLRLVEAGQLPSLTEAIEWIVPADESVPRPPNRYVVSFMVFHERDFSVPAGRFIRGVLFAYGLQLQHLYPNNIQQMAAFEAMCEGFLGIGAHLHLFRYFFRFTCLREGSRAGDDCLCVKGAAIVRARRWLLLSGRGPRGAGSRCVRAVGS
jgi:hypothetical protein